MKTTLQYLHGFTYCVVAIFLLGCASTRNRQSAGEYIDSKTLTMKVKTALWDDSLVNGFDIDVDVWKSVVQLNGFVDTLDQKRRAERIAWGVGGVASVDNNLTLKSALPGQPGAEAAGTAQPRVETESSRNSDPNVQFARISADPASFYGAPVTLDGKVDTIFSPHGFTITSLDGLPDRKLMVVASQDLVSKLRPNDRVQVSGTLREFDLLKLEQELNTRLAGRDFEKFMDQPAFVAKSADRLP